MRRFRWFLHDEAGTESAEYTVLALIIFVLIILMLLPVSERLEWLWRGLLGILQQLVDAVPESLPARPP